MYLYYYCYYELLLFLILCMDTVGRSCNHKKLLMKLKKKKKKPIPLLREILHQHAVDKREERGMVS